jgi:hypothetical protein
MPLYNPPTAGALANRVDIVATGGTGYIEMTEQSSAPGTPAADDARVFAQDDGAGLTQVVVKDSSGNVSGFRGGRYLILKGQKVMDGGAGGSGCVITSATGVVEIQAESTGVSVSASAITALGRHMDFTEKTAPAAPGADIVRIYAEDNGAGKTRLMALFSSGAAQQIAIQP